MLPEHARACVFSQIVLRADTYTTTSRVYIHVPTSYIRDRTFNFQRTNSENFANSNICARGIWKDIICDIFGISLFDPSPLPFRATTLCADIHPLVCEDPPKDPIQKIFTRNLGIFAAEVFSWWGDFSSQPVRFPRDILCSLIAGR